MITIQEYFNQTESASRALFQLVGSYLELFKASIPPIAVLRYAKEQDAEREYQAWKGKPEVIEQFANAKKASEELDAKLFSLYVVSGSILQIAHHAINSYSGSTNVPAEYSHLLKGVTRGLNAATKFSIGKDVRGVPMGLVIYAGRNQYNHLDAGAEMIPLNKNVFAALANFELNEFGYVDTGFDLNNPHLDSYSSNILSVLNWNNYDTYIQDMKQALDCP